MMPMARQAVQKDGFAIIPGVLDRPQVVSILQQLSEMPLRRSRAGARHLLADPSIAALANDSRLVRIAKEILGSEAPPFRVTFFDKSPASNWLVVWHQDTALPLRQRLEAEGWGPWSVKEGIIYAHAPTHALDQVLALRVHLDASMEENGPLRVLPGTHALGVLTDDEVSQLATKLSPVNCLVPQGGVLAMRPPLIHSSPKSLKDDRRRVLHIEYVASMMIGDGLELAVA